MDYRKLISFGKGGYVVSVPKDWVEENNLEKGSFITLEKNNGSLILMPKGGYREDKTGSEIIIDVDNKDEMTIRRELTSAYLNAYDIVQLKGENLKDYLESIKKESKTLIALEIIESTKNKIVFKDFLNYSDLSVDKIFKKTDIIIRSMFMDIKTGDKEVWSNIVARDYDVNKYFNLVLKILKKALINSSVSKALNLKIHQILIYRDNIYTLEAMGDEIKRLTKLLIKTNNKKKTDFVLKKIKLIEDSYLATMKILYKNNLEESYALYEKNKEFINGLQNFNGKSTDNHVKEMFRNMLLLNNSILRRIYMGPI